MNHPLPRPRPLEPAADRRGRATLSLVGPPAPWPVSQTVTPDRERAIAHEVRMWLARELHDVVLQRLAGLAVDIECMKRQQYGRPATLQRLDDLKHETREALESLRTILFDLRDEQACRRGLVESVRAVGACLSARTGITVRTHVHSWPARLSPEVGLHLRRIVEEALNNVRFHSRARSVDIHLESEAGWLFVTVADDGCGCPLDVGPSTGMGILGMRERAALLGGRLTVGNRPEGGLAVDVRVPMGTPA